MAKLIMMSVFTALLLSRFGLIAHEYVGHALVAHWCGATVDQCHLSMFGGGYVVLGGTRFAFLPALMIMSGGWIVEIIMGTIALVVAFLFKRRSTTHFFMMSLGCVVIIHAFYYAITGTFYGYGDGRLFYRYYKNYIYWLTPGFVLWFIVVTFHLTKLWGNHFSRWIPKAKPINKIAMALSCIIIAGAVQLTLLRVEEHYHPVELHNLAMQTESKRHVDDGVLGYTREMMEKGKTPTDQELSNKKAELEEKYDVFPLNTVLVFLLVVSIIAGIKESKTYDEVSSLPLPRWRSLVLLASCLMLLLIVIRLLPTY